ncbi:MAG: hypothetical protein KIT00_04460 [Rhodospirillales bacterium]|nr:hypothetical protein [Rhodospirillales bacterium]
MRVVWAGGMAGLVALTIAGCGTDAVNDSAGCIPDQSGRLASVDWSAAQTVDVRVRQGDYDPMVLGFMRDHPYVLRFHNGDSERHAFSSPEFFRTVALDGVAVNGEPQEQGCFSGIMIPANGSSEIRFMALLDGRYGFKDGSAFDLALGLDLDVGLGRETGMGFGVVQVR